MPIVDAKVFSIRTGYEAIIPYKAGDRFVITAKEDGKVINVSSTKLTVEYNNGKLKKVKDYPIKEWTTKEEAGICYTHKMLSNVRLGSIFKKGDTLIYDSAFFEPDIFNPSRVIFKSGAELNVALMEAVTTYEDSCAISHSVSSKLRTTTTKIKSIVLDNTDEVVGVVKQNDPVDTATPLLSITNPMIMNTKGLDAKAIEILQSLRSSTPKAGIRGTVSKITVYYNCEFSELSNTLKELAKESDKFIFQNSGKKEYTGKVNSSYSISGKPLMPGQVEIKIYINTEINMGVGDKGIFANQLKTTVGEVFKTPIYTESGDEVEAIFSLKSILARIVNSPVSIGTTTKVLDVVKNKAVDMYFSK